MASAKAYVLTTLSLCSRPRAYNSASRFFFFGGGHWAGGGVAGERRPVGVGW